MRHTNGKFSNILGAIRRALDDHPELIAFVLVCLAVLLLSLSQRNSAFYWDSGRYWRLRLQFDQGGGKTFSFLNFNDRLRSYLLPLVFYALSKVASFVGLRDELLLIITQACVFAGLLTIMIPRAIGMMYRRVITLGPVIAFSAFALYFWQGYFYYPLSDFWALFFFIAGIYVLLRFAPAAWALALAGVAIGGAALIRPIYAPAAICLILWLGFYCRQKLDLKFWQILLNMMLATLGLIGIMAPQLAINITNFGIISPMPQTQFQYGGGLLATQLSWGIEIQRYETFVGAQSVYGSPSVVFIDPHGATILAKSGYAQSPYYSRYALTLSQYAALVLRHPLDFLVLYSIHLFNGLDVVYSSPYVHDLYANTVPTRFLNYTLWFLVALYVRNRLNIRGVPSYRFLLPLIVAVPSVLSIPIAVETRFMLPLHILAYGLAAFGVLPACMSIPPNDLLRLIQQRLPWYIVFIVTAFLISSNTFANMRWGTYLFW